MQKIIQDVLDGNLDVLVYSRKQLILEELVSPAAVEAALDVTEPEKLKRQPVDGELVFVRHHNNRYWYWFWPEGE